LIFYKIHTCNGGPATPSSSSSSSSSLSGAASPLRSTSSGALFHSGVAGQTIVSGFFS